MDTIIYIFRWKQPDVNEHPNMQMANKQTAGAVLCKEDMYCREDYDLQDYQFIKLAVSEKLLQICEENITADNSRRRKESGGFFEKRRRKRIREQERALLTEFLQDIGADAGEVSFVCEEPVAYFAGREFNGYFQEKYVKHLLRYAGMGALFLGEKEKMPRGSVRRRDSGDFLTHFVVLGQTDCVQKIIYKLVDNIKSLKWILPRRLYRQEQQDFVDILYEDYGLAVEVRLMEEEESFTKVYPSSRLPAVILDFSETDRIPVMDVAKGSIWLDMGSSEEKRRRIEDRNTGLHYFSLKKEWKQPQKALNYLDTTSKNGYNT